MAHDSSCQGSEPKSAGGVLRKGVQKQQAPKRTCLAPGELHATLQSRQLINSVRLRPAAAPGAAQSARGGPHTGSVRSGSGSLPGEPRSAPAAVGSAVVACVPRTYVPVRTLPLIFAQRKRHLQRHKAAAQHTDAAYQQREGEGLLALPEDVLLKVVCLLTHEELRPLFQVCRALRETLRSAVKYHFNYSTPSRHGEEAAPPALGERKERRPPRSNVYQVMSRLSRGPRAAAAGRGSGASSRSAAPRALDFANMAPSHGVASRA